MTREEALDTMGATLDDWIDKKNMHTLIDRIFNDHEAKVLHLKHIEDEVVLLRDNRKELVAQLKAKDEHLKLIEQEYCILKGKYSKEKSKARSIVAMLFWEWRKAEARYKAEWSARRDNRQLSLLSISSSKAEVLFKQAYKMLKDNK